MESARMDGHPWAVLLAGGDGTRLETCRSQSESCWRNLPARFVRVFPRVRHPTGKMDLPRLCPGCIHAPHGFGAHDSPDRNQALRAATRRDECSRSHKTVLHRSGSEGSLSLLRIALEMASQTLDISYRRGKSDRHVEARTSQVHAKVGQRVRCTRRDSHAAARFLRMA